MRQLDGMLLWGRPVGEKQLIRENTVWMCQQNRREPSRANQNGTGLALLGVSVSVNSLSPAAFNFSLMFLGNVALSWIKLGWGQMTLMRNSASHSDKMCYLAKILAALNHAGVYCADTAVNYFVVWKRKSKQARWSEGLFVAMRPRSRGFAWWD